MLQGPSGLLLAPLDVAVSLLHAGLGDRLLLQRLLVLAHAAILHVDGGGLDVAGFGERPLGEQRTDELVDENAEQNDVLDQNAVSGAQFGSGDAHAQGHARLGKQGDAQILLDQGIAFGGRAADIPLYFPCQKLYMTPLNIA